jgi:hypothetical protein
MKLGVVLGILAATCSVGVIACSNDSSGSTQGNTGQEEQPKEKKPPPPPAELQCMRPDGDSCSTDCCSGGEPIKGLDPDEYPGCKAYVESTPEKCGKGLSGVGPKSIGAP